MRILSSPVYETFSPEKRVLIAIFPAIWHSLKAQISFHLKIMLLVLGCI